MVRLESLVLSIVKLHGLCLAIESESVLVRVGRSYLSLSKWGTLRIKQFIVDRSQRLGLLFLENLESLTYIFLGWHLLGLVCFGSVLNLGCQVKSSWIWLIIARIISSVLIRAYTVVRVTLLLYSLSLSKVHLLHRIRLANLMVWHGILNFLQ